MPQPARVAFVPDKRPPLISLHCTNALVGVAEADVFPQITLTGCAGGVNPALSGFSKVWSVAAGLTGPICAGGRILEKYRAHVATWEQAKLQDEQAVITAFQEVSSALTALEKLVSVEAAQARAVKALENAGRIANERYLGGLASYDEVLEAQQPLFPAQNRLAEVRANRLLTSVRLSKVLGGGWNLTDVQWRGPQAQSKEE